MPPFLMSNTVININGYEQAVKEINAIQRSQLKFVVSKSLNELGYWLRENEKKQISQTFNSVVPFTLNAPLYTKSDKQNLQITFFLRDTAGKGTPPAVYLQPQVAGGEVYVTGFTRKLRYAGLLQGTEYAAHWRPSNGPKLTGGRLNAILFGVGASGPTLRKQGPRTAKQASQYFILKRNENEASVRRGKPYRRKEGNGYVGPGIYTRQGGDLQQLIPIFPRPLSVPTKYDWTERRIQGLADKQFSVFFADNIARL